jgi:transposase
MGCIDEQTAVASVLTAGTCHDAPVFETVFEQVPVEHTLEHGVMDKGYDSDTIREKLEAQHIHPVIPTRKNRKGQREYNQDIYKLRNKVERLINRIKQFRRIATRYEKLATTFLAFIHMVAVCSILC